MDEDADAAAKEGPEDWMLGLCALKLSKVAVTHSGRMFQTGPDSWQEQFLIERQPVSFHKHDVRDPEEVYRTWFEESDRNMIKQNGRVMIEESDGDIFEESEREILKSARNEL